LQKTALKYQLRLYPQTTYVILSVSGNDNSFDRKLQIINKKFLPFDITS